MPKVLLLDEPSLGLAPLLVQQIFQTIQEINRQGTVVLLVEQNANLALRMANRAYVLEAGRIVLEGSGAELLANPAARRPPRGVGGPAGRAPPPANGIAPPGAPGTRRDGPTRLRGGCQAARRPPDRPVSPSTARSA
jgi:hypothetical protein